jgi:signal transduction histidine kinase
MFLAILGHDLRNPLQATMMSAGALTRSGQLDADAKEMASQISSSASVMARMIGDLLDFTASGLGVTMPLTTAPTNLEKLCRESADEISAAHPRCRINIESQGDLTGDWDAARLRQVISNLLGNAVQHTGEACRVELSLRGSESNVDLAIRNDGVPIPPEALATIFDPLVRVATPEQEKQRRPGSIGLGLYIAREVVNAHGGAIEVTSSAADGTVFTVHLPRRRASQPA